MLNRKMLEKKTSQPENFQFETYENVATNIPWPFFLDNNFRDGRVSRTREKTKFNPFTPLHSLDFLWWYLFFVPFSWRCYHLSTQKNFLSISNLISLYTFQRFRNRSSFSTFSPFLGVQLTKRPRIVYFPIRDEILRRHVWLYLPRVIASVF